MYIFTRYTYLYSYSPSSTRYKSNNVTSTNYRPMSLSLNTSLDPKL